VNERLKKVKYQMSDQQTVIFATILRLKSQIVELKTRLNKMTELKKRLLKMKDHINNQNETINDIVVHVNANISEICKRIKAMKNNIERMN
jgi:chromosome segregation ATPase